jgi:predicted HicB family RNase H-like nuclease
MAKDEWHNFSVRVPATLYKRLSAVAKRELSSLNRETNIAIRAHLDAMERRTK